jgi:hypothetical protein
VAFGIVFREIFILFDIYFKLQEDFMPFLRILKNFQRFSRINLHGLFTDLGILRTFKNPPAISFNRTIEVSDFLYAG